MAQKKPGMMIYFEDYKALRSTLCAEEFVQLLEFANRFPAEFDWENFDWSSQPSTEPVSYSDAPFMYAYRPVATEENNIYYNEYYAD